MIEKYTTEQYLPCHEGELLGNDNSKSLPEGDPVIYLNGRMELLPMFNGGMLVTQYGLFYLDEHACSVLDLLRIPKCKSELIHKPMILKELERFHYYGIINFKERTFKGLTTYPVPNDIKQLYENDEYGWFFYYPTRIELDLSNFCNLKCIHCSRNASTVPINGEISLNLIKKILHEAAQIGVYSIQIMGGEPLVYEYFFEVCEYAKKVGINHLDTSSNGWVINKETARRLSMYFDEIQLSLHGSTPETHDFIVGHKGAWRKLMNAADYLIEEGVKVRLNMSVLHENLCELDEMPKLARNMGANTLRFLALSNEGRGKNLKELTISDRENIGQKIKVLSDYELQIKSDLRIESGGFPPLSPINKYALFFGCPAGRELLYINSSGYTSCCGVIQEFIGNIMSKSIVELWHHENMIKLRKPQKCQCDYKFICSGPCLSNYSDPFEKKNNY